MPDEAGSPELLTLQEAAERLKVHYMTAYRWVRRGELTAFKAGGRLRVLADDVDRFVQQRRVDVVLPGIGGRTDWPTHIDRLYALLVEGQAVEAGHLVRKVIADGAPTGQVYLDLLTPVLHRIGDDWANGTVTVAQEHRASEICASIIARHSEAFRRRGPSRGVAVTMAPANEQHGIAVAMLADFLRAAGFEVHHLGVNVPAEDLRLFLQGVPCDVLCVSVTTGADADVYRDVVTAATNGTSPLVIFGGNGVDPAQVAAVSATHVEALADVVACLDEVGADLVSVSSES